MTLPVVWWVVLLLAAVQVALKLRRAGTFTWTLATWLSLWIFVRFGFSTPVPQSVQTLYMAIATGATAAYVTSERPVVSGHDVVYVTEVNLVDVADPSAAALLGIVPVPEPFGARSAGSGDRLLVASRVLRSFDVSDPAMPVELAGIGALAADDVAAGEGALRTWSTRSVPPSWKSSTSAPSRASAWARTPDGPKTSWSPRSAGTYRWSSCRNARLDRSRHISKAPMRQ